MIELYDVVRTGRRPADNVVGEFFRARRYLGAKDRRFIAEMVFGLLRHYRLVEFYAEGAFRLAGGAPSTLNMPAVALICAHAIKVSGESPDLLAPDLCGLWRVYVPDTDCARFLEAISSATLPIEAEKHSARGIAIRFSFPEMIVDEWMDRYGPDETALLCTSLNSPAPTTIRVNTLATTVEQCRNALIKEGVETQRTTMSPVGLTFSKRINAQALRSFKQGFFEMQDEGSQLLSLLTGAAPGATVVDACAGGGGKTLHLAALMNNQGTLLSIDVEEMRLKNIRQRLTRAGVSIAQLCLVNRDRELIRQWAGKADVVLLDAPCSGVGTFRRNPGAKITFTGSFVERVVQTQHEVLEEYAMLVKPGGRLVYSTCTLLKKENEDQVEGFLSRRTDFELISASELLSPYGVRIASGGPYLTLLPHKTMTDGFFAAVVTRRV